MSEFKILPILTPAADTPSRPPAAAAESSAPAEASERYWTTLADYERRPEAEQRRGEEFASKPETYFNAQSKGGLHIDRRDFFKWSTAALALATEACTRKPIQHLVPYAQQPSDVLPGVADYYASTCTECAAGCGIVVKTREGRPIKLEGNPLHPLNRGTACARGQATFFNLYDPDRLHRSVNWSRGGRAPRPLAWPQADARIARAFKAAGKNGVLLTGTVHGPARTQLLADFCAQFGARRLTYDAWNPDALTAAQAAVYGAPVVPRYRFDQAEMVVTFGADPIGSGPSRQEYSVGFGRQRKLRGGKMSRVVSFEPAMSLTGMNADSRYLVRADYLLEVALALANQLVLQDGRSSFATDPVVKQALALYSPDQVEPRAGLRPGTLAAVAAELWQNRGQGIIYATGIAGHTGDAAALEITAAFLNAALQNEGATVDGTASPSLQAQGSDAAMLQLVEQMRAGQVQALLIYGTNPAYTLPASVDFAGALAKVPFVTVVSQRMDETARLADLVLAGLHGMESWGDAEPQTGAYSLIQPTIRPLFEGRGFEDTLIAVARAGGSSQFEILPPAATAPVPAPAAAAATSTPPAGKTSAAKPAASAAAAGAPPPAKPLPMDFHAYLQKIWRQNIYAKNQLSSTFEDFWTSALRDGVFVPNPNFGQPGAARKCNTSALLIASRAAGRQKHPRLNAGELLLSLSISPVVGDGASNNNALLLETTDPVAKICWENYLSISPAAAQRLKIGDGSVVEITVAGRSVRVPVHVQPGVQAESASLALGWGRASVGSIGNNVGVNAWPLAQASLAAPAAAPGTAHGTTPGPAPELIYSGFRIQPMQVATGYHLASPQGNNYLEGRKIVQSATLVQIQANPHAGAIPVAPNENLWNNSGPGHHFPQHHWGMTIDLNACTGCNACVVACHIENNVPLVGKEQVRIGRDMDWLRIDRYFTGEFENPDVVNEPMLCQQCANAGCESVCPVLATVTNSEGLNLQVYNRCVGTRFCSNNCIYKVRRFNFYEYSHDKYSWGRGTPLELALNPDVTVRTRGIMEKCTFCVQRINAAHTQAQNLGVPIADGAIKTACQQTCPSQAIYFGDMNDRNSLMMRQRGARGFRVLEDLNFQPSVTYLTKVRNQPPAAAGEGKA